MAWGVDRLVVIAAVGAAALWAASAATAAEVTWRASIWGPKRASSDPLVWYAKEVTAKTGGQLKIEFTFDQGKATESVDRLS